MKEISSSLSTSHPQENTESRPLSLLFSILDKPSFLRQSSQDTLSSSYLIFVVFWIHMRLGLVLVAALFVSVWQFKNVLWGQCCLVASWLMYAWSCYVWYNERRGTSFLDERASWERDMLIPREHFVKVNLPITVGIFLRCLSLCCIASCRHVPGTREMLLVFGRSLVESCLLPLFIYLFIYVVIVVYSKQTTTNKTIKLNKSGFWHLQWPVRDSLSEAMSGEI